MERIKRISLLYYNDHKSMRQIGRLFGISRERVRQLMERAGFSRRSSLEAMKLAHKTYSNRSTHNFDTEEDYFEHVKKTGKEHQPSMSKFFRNADCRCEHCGKNGRLNVHHLKYPATKRSELIVLCYTCHRRVHGYGLTTDQIVSLSQDYLNGTPPIKLAKKYGIKTHPNVYYYLKKAGVEYRFGRRSLIWQQN